MGYGATLGTWYMNGRAPLEVTCTVDQTPGIEVDQHAIAVCRYATGLSRMETRWGTFTDPWTHPAAADLRLHLRGLRRHHRLARLRQPRDGPDPRPARAPRDPADPLKEGERNAIEYVLGCFARGEPVGGPLDPALCLTAQRIVDTAARPPPRNARWS
jgi:predicted dehydrogenase